MNPRLLDDMRITSKGQVIIRIEIREKLRLLRKTEVQVDLVGTTICIREARGRQTPGSALVSSMRGRGTVTMTTDRILALRRGERLISVSWPHRLTRANRIC